MLAIIYIFTILLIFSCLLQGFPAVLAFLIPVALCVSVNTIGFVLILRSLIKSSSTITSTKKTSGVEQARRGAAISVYLGLTWIAGFLAIGIFSLSSIHCKASWFSSSTACCRLRWEQNTAPDFGKKQFLIRRLIAQPRWHPNPWPLRWSTRREK